MLELFLIHSVLKETIGPRGNDHFILTGTDCIQLAYATGNENVTLTNYSSLLTKGFEDDIVHLREVVTLAVQLWLLFVLINM